MKKILLKIISYIAVGLAFILTYISIFPRTKIELKGKYKPIASKGGMNITKDITSAINTKKPLKRAKKDKKRKLFKRKNRK